MRKRCFPAARFCIICILYNGFAKKSTICDRVGKARGAGAELARGRQGSHAGRGVYRSEAFGFAPALVSTTPLDDGAKYRSVRFAGGRGTPLPRSINRYICHYLCHLDRSDSGAERSRGSETQQSYTNIATSCPWFATVERLPPTTTFKKSDRSSPETGKERFCRKCFYFLSCVCRITYSSSRYVRRISS